MEQIDSVNTTCSPTEKEIHSVTDNNIAFAFLGVLIPLVAILGVVGNALILLVMTRGPMIGPSNCLLAARAVSDTALLLLQIPYYYVVHDYSSRHVYALSSSYYWIVWYVASHVFMTTSCWLTTAMVLERFFSRRSGRSTNDSQQDARCSKLNRVIVTAAVIFLVAVLLNLSKCFEFEPTTDISELKHARKTWLLDVAAYVKVRSVLYTVLVVVIPVVLMIVFTSLLLRHLLNHRREMKYKWNGPNSGFSLDMYHITISVFAVVVIFVLIYSLEVYNSLMLSIYDSDIYKQENVRIVAVYLKNFMVVVSSSVNFLVCVTINEMFRKTLAELRDKTLARVCRRQTLSEAESCQQEMKSLTQP